MDQGSPAAPRPSPLPRARSSRDLRNLVQYLTTAYEGRDLEHVLEPLAKLRRAPDAGSPGAPPTPAV